LGVEAGGVAVDKGVGWFVVGGAGEGFFIAYKTISTTSI